MRDKSELTYTGYKILPIDEKSSNFSVDHQLDFIYGTRFKKYHFFIDDYPYWGRGTFFNVTLFCSKIGVGD